MLCISHIDYANAVLYGTTKKVLNKYQTLQNMCAKLVLGKSKYSKYDSASQTLQQLPLSTGTGKNSSQNTHTHT